MVEYEIARRTPRYHFAVDVTVINIEQKIDIKARTNTLGLFGCGIDTSKPFAQGTSVRIKMRHRGVEVKALGMVVYSRPDLGMGISFIAIDKEDEWILELWILELMRTEARG
jgi:hypothetical protein